MVIRKGSIYWVDFSPGKGSEPMGRRPGLVLQSDILNDSKINTVIMLSITSTIPRMDWSEPRSGNAAQDWIPASSISLSVSSESDIPQD